MKILKERTSKKPLEMITKEELKKGLIMDASSTFTIKIIIVGRYLCAQWKLSVFYIFFMILSLMITSLPFYEKVSIITYNYTFMERKSYENR